jgi:cupin superfamily acireductone dioxygenase involved in methionine salvage
MHDDLAVRVRLEGRGVFQALSQSDVVVDFTVDGENDSLVLVDEGLGASVCLLE